MVLKLWSSARYRATRRRDGGGNCHAYAAIGIPGMPRKFGGPDFARGKRFNSEIISSMIESLIYDRTRRATRLDRVSDRQHLQGKHV
jgi:hypothetical protein